MGSPSARKLAFRPAIALVLFVAINHRTPYSQANDSGIDESASQSPCVVTEVAENDQTSNDEYVTEEITHGG